MDKTRLSQKSIPRNERLIFALDVENREQALKYINLLGDSVLFYKLGLELFMADGYFQLLDELVNVYHKKVFVDLKFFDVPETVRSAIRQLNHRGASFTTVHGNDGMLKAAAEERRNDLKILAVTALTSLDEGDLRALGFECDVTTLVLSRAERAIRLGCNGVIASGQEAAALRDRLGDNFLIVSPGIRPIENRTVDDQKRIMTPQDAFLSGADYIVVGRPIREAADPRLAAEKIQHTLESLFDQ